jgi:hypothetical protein
MTELGEDIEFEIKPLPSGFRATLHTFRRGRWSPPDTRICASKREAMVWINSQLALRGFAEAYEWRQGVEEVKEQLIP